VDTRKIEAGDVSVKMRKKLFFFSFKLSDNVLNLCFSYSSVLEVFKHNDKILTTPLSILLAWNISLSRHSINPSKKL